MQVMLITAVSLALGYEPSILLGGEWLGVLKYDGLMEGVEVVGGALI